MKNLATDRFRWLALVFLALGLAIVIIDNNVLNVAVPYILRDLNTTVDNMQWVISGYALIIATLLITVGRIGDLIGRKKVFLLGVVLFAIGSFIASISTNVVYLFIGEALIEAFGAAMMLTSSLSLLASEFHGRERAIAFGIWGSVAGASASLGPLLGGYLTAYYSWRWSLRINVVVALITILGSIFIKEAKGEGGKDFDWWGTAFSGAGLFSLVFALIEGRKYGWWAPADPFSIGSWNWPLTSVSIIPFAFGIAILALIGFIVAEFLIEKRGGHPLLRLTMFRNLGFSVGLATLLIVSLGQFGIFFVMPIYIQNVLGLNAFQTGLMFLWATVTVMIFGPLSGIVSSRIGSKWPIAVGMIFMTIAVYLLTQTISTDSTWLSLGLPLIFFGIGIGVPSAQLTNTVLSSVKPQLAGEASAANATMRQVGTSVGVAIIGAVLAGTVTTRIGTRVNEDPNIPTVAKTKIVQELQNVSVERGTALSQTKNINPVLENQVKSDVNLALVDGAKSSLKTAFLFILIGTIVAIFLPNSKHHEEPGRLQKQES